MAVENSNQLYVNWITITDVRTNDAFNDAPVFFMDVPPNLLKALHSDYVLSVYFLKINDVIICPRNNKIGFYDESIMTIYDGEIAFCNENLYKWMFKHEILSEMQVLAQIKKPVQNSIVDTVLEQDLALENDDEDLDDFLANQLEAVSDKALVDAENSCLDATTTNMKNCLQDIPIDYANLAESVSFYLGSEINSGSLIESVFFSKPQVQQPLIPAHLMDSVFFPASNIHATSQPSPNPLLDSVFIPRQAPVPAKPLPTGDLLSFS